MGGVLEGKGPLKLSGLQSQSLVQLPLSIEIDQKHRRTGALHLYAPVYIVNLSVEYQAQQSQVDAVFLVPFFVAGLILQYAVAAQFHVVIPFFLL